MMDCQLVARALLCTSLLCALVTAADETTCTTQCTAQCIGKSGCYLTDSAAAEIDSQRTVCVLNNVDLTANPVCADVCDLNRAASGFMTTVPGEANPTAADLNAAFQQMVVGVRAGNNGNVECTGAPDWWKAMNHDWCHPGKPCDTNMVAAKIDDCTVDSDRSVCRGVCVVDPAGPGGRACWDMCDRNHIPMKYGEGARAGIQEEVEAARTDGTCSTTTWVPWFLLILFFVLVALCVAGFFFLKMKGGKGRKGGNSGFRGGGQGFDPVLDVPNREMDQMPRDDFSRPMPAPPPPPQEQMMQQQQMMQPPTPQTNTRMYMQEPQLPIPQLQPPRTNSTQVQPQAGEYQVSYGQPHPVGMQASYGAQPGSGSYQVGQPSYSSYPPQQQQQIMTPNPYATQAPNFQSQPQQGGFQFYK